MKYLISIQIDTVAEIEAQDAAAALNAVKANMDPRQAASARFEVIQELKYDEESKTYKVL